MSILCGCLYTSLFKCYIFVSLWVCKYICDCSVHLRFFFLHTFYSLHGVFFHLCACQRAMSTLQCICGCVSTLDTSLCEPAIFSPPPRFFSVICLCRFFFSASATCVVAMFLCLYISEHLLFQQGPHGLKCQSKQLPDKCIVQQACVSPPPIPPLLVLWC